MKARYPWLFAVALAACGPTAAPPKSPKGADVPQPPVAKTVPHTWTTHGHARQDPYHWLRDDERKNPEMLAYLNAENAYTEQVMAPDAERTEALFEELKARLKQDDRSVPVRRRGYWYYSRYETGKEHAVHCRRPAGQGRDPKVDAMREPEQVLLDVNALAEPHDYYALGGYSVSENEQLLAYAEDTVSRRKYTIRFKDLRTGELLDDHIDEVASSIAWAADNRTLFYVKKHPETLREYQVWRHVLGTDAGEDVMVHDEPDESFYVSIGRSRSRRFVEIYLSSTLVSETRVLEASDPSGAFRPVLPREPKHEYTASHHGDHFYIRTNWQAENFRLMRAELETSADKASWEEVVPHRSDVLLTRVVPFDSRLVLGERKDGLRQLRVRSWDGAKDEYVAFEEAVYVAYAGSNPDPDSTRLRFEFSSPVTPQSVFELDMDTGERTLLKQDEVLGGYDPSRYRTERLDVVARDGASIPVSLVYPKGLKKDGSAPLYQYGYGSYGLSMDPWFSSSRISLLDRGFVVAVAHIRGGQERGRPWYNKGRMFEKMNTFTDFIDVTEHLVKSGYAHPRKVFAEGASAGGLLMGAVANMRPDLYLGMHAGVPFVDVVTTMLDDSIPLTTNEYDEWGNPNNKDSYEYMLSYSPYDNVKAQAYPHMLVTTGLHDSQVQYFEPAKWVARLRATKTDEHLLLLQTEMETGHGGASGRFKSLKRRALIWSFFLKLLGSSAEAS